MLDVIIIPSETVDNDIPVGDIDGVNTTFSTTFDYTSGSLKVYLNGLRQKSGLGNDYIESGSNGLVMNVPPEIGDVLIVDYLKD